MLIISITFISSSRYLNLKKKSFKFLICYVITSIVLTEKCIFIFTQNHSPVQIMKSKLITLFIPRFLIKRKSIL